MHSILHQLLQNVALNSLSTRSTLSPDHLQSHIQLLPISKLLIVKLTIPQHPDLPPPKSKQANQSEHEKLRNQSKRQLNRTNNTDEHPSDSPNKESNSPDNQIHFGRSASVKTPQITKQHPRENQHSDRHPRTLLVIDRIKSRHLQFKRVVIAIQE